VSNEMAFQWTALATATSYTVQRSTDGTNFTTIATGVTTTNYADNTVSPVNGYYYRIFGVSENTISVYSSVIFAATPVAAALPSPWQSNDINITTTNGNRTGAAGISGTTLTVVGGGSDIWGTSDQFRFTYVSMSGNGSITARVTSLLDTNYYSRAGVMIRNTTTGTNTAANSQFAAVMVHQSDAGVRYQYRTTTGGGTGETVFGGASEAAPYWVRLTRTGNSFFAEASSNGTTWSTVGTQNIAMNSTVLVGLALTPRENSLLNRATFNNVTITTTSGTITLSGAGSSGAATAGQTSGGNDGSAVGSGSTGTLTGKVADKPQRTLSVSPSALITLGSSNIKAKKTLLDFVDRSLYSLAKTQSSQRSVKQLALVDSILAEWQSNQRERSASKAKVPVAALELLNWRK
jgi:regulation of enolase protein 1 (concanavalin A-like superfamily)